MSARVAVRGGRFYTESAISKSAVVLCFKRTKEGGGAGGRGRGVARHSTSEAAAWDAHTGTPTERILPDSESSLISSQAD